MARDPESPVDVLFVNPPSPDGFVYIRDINRHGRSSWERIIWPQTSLAYLAAVARELGLSVRIADCIAEKIGWRGYLEILGKCRPRYCFSNIISVTYSNDLRALREAKAVSGAVTVGMGPHLTNAPEKSLEEGPGLDFVILHEAEATLKELLEYCESHPNPAVDELSRIKGIAFFPGRVAEGGNGGAVVTERREFIEDLDSLPRPLHELLPLKKYWSPFLGHYTFVEASRGCAYRCIFCRQAVMWQWRYRRRSGKAIAEEALYVHSLGINNILFHADTFTLSREMVEEICRELIKSGAGIRWACNSHIRNLYGKPDLVRLMKRAGCWMIALGIESGDDEILRTIRKETNVAEIESVVRMVADEGIEPWGYFVLGFPGETVETMEKTMKLARRLPLPIAKFDIAAPYPGTEFYRYASEKGYLKVDRYEQFDQNASAVVEYPDLSRKQIKAAVRRATRRFYFRPRILLRAIREIRSVTMLKTLILIARDQFRLLAGAGRSRKDATVVARPTDG
jgi:radical SAM superfamily enzyme YgiQ (UPF0313 family)